MPIADPITIGRCHRPTPYARLSPVTSLYVQKSRSGAVPTPPFLSRSRRLGACECLPATLAQLRPGMTSP